MKLLIYEHVTAGGLGRPAGQSLLGEADAMVQALTRDFQALDGVEVVVPRCASLAPSTGSGRARTLPMHGDARDRLASALPGCDLALIVAPESGHILHRLSLAVESAGLASLGATPGAIATASDKWLTWLALEAAGVPQIPTLRADRATRGARTDSGRWVLKPALGCGCEGIRIFEHRQQAVDAARALESAGPDWILQPWLHGTAASLSLLGHRNGTDLLAVNRQRLRLDPAGTLELAGLDVGVLSDGDGMLARLVADVAAAVPGLHGAFGIDVLLTANGPRVVEINPRVTSAWPALAGHCHGNPARRWLELWRGDRAVPGERSRRRPPLAPARMAAQPEAAAPADRAGPTAASVGDPMAPARSGRPGTGAVAHCVVGWDLGGAHLKVAALDPRHGLLEVIQEPCALWLGLERLTPLLHRLASRWGRPLGHAVTMSGEMVDLFPDRTTGVQALLRAFTGAAGEVPVQVYCGEAGFLAPGDTPGREPEIASANWLAAGAWAARQRGSGILLDIGSTTTDLLCFDAGRSWPLAMGDADRLASDELIYTGVTRTPLMALAPRVPLGGRSIGLMAEWFASTADVYRLLGQLPEDADQHPSADGAPKTAAASERRLARMVGCDGPEYPSTEWYTLAEFFRQRQLDLIRPALEQAAQRLARHRAAHATTSGSSEPDAAPVLVTAGVGRFLAPALAAAQGMDIVDFGELVGLATGEAMLADRASRCAPAVAVAALLAQER